jgi:hypothetical protein
MSAVMRKVRLQFPSLFHIWSFKQSFRQSVVQSTLGKRSLICLYSEALVELAEHAYEAKVVAVE